MPSCMLDRIYTLPVCLRTPCNIQQLFTKSFAQKQTVTYAFNLPPRTIFLYLHIYTPLTSNLIYIPPPREL